MTFHSKNHHYCFAILAIAACGSLLGLSAGAAGDGDYSFDTISLGAPAPAIPFEEMTDSMRTIYVDSLAALAADSYKRIVTLKADGEAYDRLFPAIYRCYEKNMEVFNLAQPNTAARRQAINTLITLDPELESGAYFYNGKGDQTNMERYVRAYLDIQLLDDLKDYSFKRSNAFPTYATIAVTNAFNAKEYDRAIEYSKLYLSTGDNNYREKIIMALGQSAYNTKNYDLAVAALKEGLKQYPFNETIAKLGVNACSQGGHGESLQEFLTAVLTVAPDDQGYLDLQGKLYEDDNKYEQAIDIYTRLDELRPNDIYIAKHLAVCFFNLGVQHFNDAVYSSDEKISRKNRRLAKNYFGAASQQAQEITAKDPLNAKYLTILARTYLCLEEKEKFEEINRQLMALGQDPVSEMFMPAMVNYNESNTKNFDYVLGSNNLNDGIEAPPFTEYSHQFIVEAMGKWSKQGEFERSEDYAKRVNDVTIRQHIEELSRQAEDTYLEAYGKKLRIADMKLMPYDASNETFLVETSYGPFTLKVPLKDGEAERFKSGWETMNFRNPKYYIDNNRVQIAAITVETPTGKAYTYDVTKGGNYDPNKTKIDYESILHELTRNNRTAVASNTDTGKEKVITKKSDVDVNIPHTGKMQPKTFALIIANENYRQAKGHQTGKVASALHDGEVFEQYCSEVLGIPEANIIKVTDATVGTLTGAISQFVSMVKSFGPSAEAIVYYVGHGIPDERTKNAYMLPVDGIPTVPRTCYPLDQFYEELADMGAGNVTVFIDACFSGAQRDGSMHYAARGVSLATNRSALNGNMVVFSAASGDETASAYADKNHGMFTYFLLKKLQETKGNVTLKDLSDYVITNVTQHSNTVNKKQQTPQVNVSANMSEQWKKKKLVR